jgi:hypothetical protein
MLALKHIIHTRLTAMIKTTADVKEDVKNGSFALIWMEAVALKEEI